MGKRSDEKMPNIISHWEMQIKTTSRYHFTHTRMTVMEKKIIVSVIEDVEKQTLMYCWWDMKWYSHSGKWTGSSLKLRLNTEFLYDPTSPLLSTQEK